VYSLFVNHLEPLSYFICFVTYFLILRMGEEFKIKVLFLFFLLATVVMGYSSYLVHVQISNIFTYNLVLLPLSIIAFHLYFMQIFRGKIKQACVKVLFLANVAVFIFTTFFSNQAVYFNSIGFSSLGLSVTVCCFLFFHERLSNVSEANIYDSIDFWVICGLFIAYSGSFIVFLTYHYLTLRIMSNPTLKERQLLTILWGVPNIFLFINSLISLSGYIWVLYRRKFIS